MIAEIRKIQKGNSNDSLTRVQSECTTVVSPRFCELGVETQCFCEILSLNYGPGTYGPGPLGLRIVWESKGSPLSNN